MAKQVVAAWKDSNAPVARLPAGHDSHVVTTRGRAHDSLDDLAAAEAHLPYLGFTTTPRDKRALRRAEKQLVWSLRKAADGIASKAINRRLSLPITWLLMRTRIHPNHVTLFCFGLALTGGFVISRGGYLAGVIGMLLVNLGSIIDGVDGELARLKYRFSRLGQWLDTLADDFGNIAYISGIALNLRAGGNPWALPFATCVLACFIYTQATQYWLIARVYRSGDLASIPWAYQSHDFLSSNDAGLKATLAKMLKRDFALTMFVVLAACGELRTILLCFSAGALSFAIAFTVQLLRNIGSIRAELSRSPR
jgi:phosphatidylglycerophosphate synthase